MKTRLAQLFLLALAGFTPCGLVAQTATSQPLTPLGLRAAIGKTAPEELAGQVLRSFGKQGLDHGKARLEATTGVWVLASATPARVLRDDGKEIGSMKSLHGDLQVLVAELTNFTEFDWHIEAGGRQLGSGRMKVEHFAYQPDSLPQSGVPAGKLEKFEWKDSKVFPSTVRDVTVYIPAQYDGSSPACLMVFQDGTRQADRQAQGGLRVPVVFDNLIQKKEMPVTIGVFIDPGRRLTQKAGDKAANRGFEYDSLGDAYSRFLLEEILPEVVRRYDLKLRPEARYRAIGGGSSGGICAFTAAWERPDQFGKVLSWVGSFVNLRGGHVYPSLVRLTERKPIRVYLLDGVNDLDNPYGNWPLANRQMAAALDYQHYDSRIDWTECFHGSKGMAAALPDALRWLWRDVR